MTSFSEKVTQSQKYANGKQYYKDRLNMGSTLQLGGSVNSFSTFGDSYGDLSDMKRWYDLYNGIIDKAHFQSYCGTNKLKAFAGITENLINRDIVSSRIDTILGVESSRPFKYQAIAINPEATSMREEKENELLKQYLLQKMGGQEIPQEQLPPNIKKYMARKYQVPQEVMANQVLRIGEKRQRLQTKFLKGLKHQALSSWQIYLVAPENGEPTVRVVNPLFFKADMGRDNSEVHMANSAEAIYMLHPAEVCQMFKDEITSSEIDRVWEAAISTNSQNYHSFDEDASRYDGTVPVVHRVWRGMRKVGFLTYMDQEGKEQEMMVSENYRLNKEQGDIKISWDWLEEVHQGYKILEDIFFSCGPVPYQHVIAGDLSRPWLPYVGGVYDNMNSKVVSKMGRMESYQYFYNIMMTTIDRLVSSDKGKKLGLDMSAVPKSLGIGLKELLAHMEEDDLIPLNSGEEGKRGENHKGITSLLSSIDLSPATQISVYEQLAEMAYQKAGITIGITPQMEGFVKEREAAQNVQNSISLSSSKLDPFFKFHDNIKVDVLMAYLKLAQLMYYENPPKHLAYSSDDMSISLLELDPEQFLAANYTIYINDSSKTHDAQANIDRYLQAALQNQTIDPSAALAAMRQDSFQDAEEILSQSSEEARMRAMEAQKAEQEAVMAQLKAKADQDNTKYAHEKEMLILKEKERRITEVAKQIILAQGFNEEKDMDKDGKADVQEFGMKIIEEARKINEKAVEESAIIG